MTVPKPSWQRLYLYPLLVVAAAFALLFGVAFLGPDSMAFSLFAVADFGIAWVVLSRLQRRNQPYFRQLAASRGRRYVPHWTIALAVLVPSAARGIAVASGAPAQVRGAVFLVALVAVIVGIRVWSRRGRTST